MNWGAPCAGCWRAAAVAATCACRVRACASVALVRAAARAERIILAGVGALPTGHGAGWPLPVGAAVHGRLRAARVGPTRAGALKWRYGSVSTLRWWRAARRDRAVLERRSGSCAGLALMVAMSCEVQWQGCVLVAPLLHQIKEPPTGSFPRLWSGMSGKLETLARKYIPQTFARLSSLTLTGQNSTEARNATAAVPTLAAFLSPTRRVRTAATAATVTKPLAPAALAGTRKPVAKKDHPSG